MLNVSVLTERRGGGGERWRRSSSVSQLANVPGTERERERGKKFLLGDSVRSHSTRETRFASRSNERISTFASSILLEYLISLRKYMNEGENPIHRFIVPWNFIQQSSLLPIDEKREKNTNEWISERANVYFFERRRNASELERSNDDNWFMIRRRLTRNADGRATSWKCSVETMINHWPVIPVIGGKLFHG